MPRRIEIATKVAAFLALTGELIGIMIQKQMPPDAARIAGIFIGAAGDTVFIVSVVT